MDVAAGAVVGAIGKQAAANLGAVALEPLPAALTLGEPKYIKAILAEHRLAGMEGSYDPMSGVLVVSGHCGVGKVVFAERVLEYLQTVYPNEKVATLGEVAEMNGLMDGQFHGEQANQAPAVGQTQNL